MTDLGQAALGAWSGGVHMHFGVPIGRERLTGLLRPGDDIGTVITVAIPPPGRSSADSRSRWSCNPKCMCTPPLQEPSAACPRSVMA